MTEKSGEKVFVAIAWPYANGDMHVGHPAGYLLPADVFIRYNRLKGNDVLAVTGSDMHGTPIAVKAEKEGVPVEKFAEKYHKSHMENVERMMLDVSLWTRTSTDNHREVVQKLFLEIQKNGFIIKKKVKQYWSEKEKKFLLDRYIEGTCPNCGFAKARGDQCDNCGHTHVPTDLINPYSVFGDKELKLKETEDFFLDLKSLQPILQQFYENHPNYKNWRKHVKAATEAWFEEGLEPRAITRDLNYGVPLPEEAEIERKDEKVFYVWFEAVTGYLSAAVEYSKRLGEETEYPDTKVTHDDVILNAYEGQDTIWENWWKNPGAKHYYFMGKDNITFHSIVWPGMIIAANVGRDEKDQLNLLWDLPANQYLNLAGAKFSKSTGVILDTKEFIEEFGLDAVRYYLISRMPENKDYDFTWEEFIDANNNELVANLGNFINRTLSFYQNKMGGSIGAGQIDKEVKKTIETTLKTVGSLIEESEYVKAIQEYMKLSDFANKYFDTNEIWQVIKTDEKVAKNVMYNLLQLVEALRLLMRPFLPVGAEKLSNILGREFYVPIVDEDKWQFSEAKETKLTEEVTILFGKLDKTEVLERKLQK